MQFIVNEGFKKTFDTAEEAIVHAKKLAVATGSVTILGKSSNKEITERLFANVTDSGIITFPNKNKLIHELEALPWEAYLNPENFATEHDNPNDTKRQYQEGLSVGNEWDNVYVNYGSVWAADKPRSYLSSYETIGYHKNTKDLLKGFLDANTNLSVTRLRNGLFITTSLKKRK